MATKQQNRKDHSVSAIFIIYSISAIQIRLVFSHAKLMISWLQCLEKRWGAHAHWWAIDIFQLEELSIKANQACFSKWRCKLWKDVERMHKVNVRNHNKILLPMVPFQHRSVTSCCQHNGFVFRHRVLVSLHLHFLSVVLLCWIHWLKVYLDYWRDYILWLKSSTCQVIKC